MAALALAVFVATASAQGFRRGNRFFEQLRAPTPESFDGSFNFCRIMFPHDPSFDGYASAWWVDYPRADINLSIRLSELTKTRISRQPDGEPNHLVMDFNDPAMFNCPFIMMTEPGAAYIGQTEAVHLREYLLKGGFLWADDFWGTDAWEHFAGELVEGPAAWRVPDHAISHAIIRSSTRSSRLRACRRFHQSATGGALAVRRLSSAPTARRRTRAASRTHTAA